MSVNYDFDRDELAPPAKLDAKGRAEWHERLADGLDSDVVRAKRHLQAARRNGEHDSSYIQALEEDIKLFEERAAEHRAMAEEEREHI